jgi:hypothetical protein
MMNNPIDMRAHNIFLHNHQVTKHGFTNQRFLYSLSNNPRNLFQADVRSNYL